jgi:ribosomal protein L22
VSPANPQDPSTGKPFEEEQAAQDAKDAATEAAAQKSEETPAEAPKPKRTRAKKEPAPAQAEGTAAEETGVDKAGAEAAAVTEPAATEKPKRSRAKKDEAKPAAPAPAPTRSRRRGRVAGERVIVRAQAKYVRSSPRKSRLVCDGIRGKSVTEARAILAFHPRAVAEAWSKLLESAVANAENNHDLVGEDLKIHAVFADAGPTIKRFRPRAMGRATRIRKRTSHLTIQLTPKDS